MSHRKDIIAVVLTFGLACAMALIVWRARPVAVPNRETHLQQQPVARPSTLPRVEKTPPSSRPPKRVAEPPSRKPEQRAAAVTPKQKAAMKTVRESVVRVLGGGVTFDNEKATPSRDDDYTYYVTGTATSNGARKRYKATVYYYDGAFVLGVLSRPDGTTLR